MPSDLGNCINLASLAVFYNILMGSILADMCNCTNLAYLALSYNNLTRSIPQNLGSLTHLEQLYLGVNFLTGTICLCVPLETSQFYYFSNCKTVSHFLVKHLKSFM